MNISLLDTDILSYFLKGDKSVIQKVQDYLLEHDKILFSEITYYEILAGLEYKKAVTQIENFILFKSKCNILKLSENSIKLSAEIYGKLRRSGMKIGTPDLLIAGIAIVNKMDLITITKNTIRLLVNLRLVIGRVNL